MNDRPTLSEFNQSAEKALRILEYLASCQEPQRLMDISAKLKMNSTTALRFLNSLQKCGYVEQEPDSMRYFMTFKICKLANQKVSSLELSQITHPYLVRLSDQFGESTCVSVERNMRMVYVDVATSANRILMGQQFVGNAVPMHCTGNGKLLLMQYSDEQLDELIRVRGLKQYTPHTFCTKESLKQELNDIRRKGYAMDNEESELGARCIAYPIRNYTGKIIAGISVTGPVARITAETLQDKKVYLQETAEEISKVLGY